MRMRMRGREKEREREGQRKKRKKEKEREQIEMNKERNLSDKKIFNPTSDKDLSRRALSPCGIIP